MAFLLFVAGNLLAALAAREGATLLLGEARGWRRLALSLGLFPVCLLLAILPVGSLGMLNVWACVALIGGGAALLSLARRSQASRSRGAVPLGTAQEGGGLWLATNMGLLAGFGTLLATKALLGASGFSYDDLMYHAVAPGYWLTEGGLRPPPFNWEASYYPMNSELVSLWFMLPFRSDALVSLTPMLWLLVGTAAICCLARALGCSRGSALFAAAAFIVSAPVRDSLDTFSGTDVSGVVMILAALAIVVRREHGRSGALSGLEGLAAGLLVGFAVGSKVSFAPAGAVLVLFLLAVEWRATPPGNRLQNGGLVLLGAAATGSYWYIRNLLLTGNPVFPAEVGPFSGPLTTSIQVETSLAWKLLGDPARVENWRQLVEAQSAWPAACLVLAVCGYVGTAIRLGRGQAGRAQRGLLAVLGLTSALLGAIAPFSGSINDLEAVFKFDPRYFLLPLAVGLVLFAELLDGSRPRFVLPGRALGLLCVVLSLERMGLKYTLIILAAGAGAIWCGLALRPQRLLQRRVRSYGIPLLLLLFVCIAAVVPGKQRKTDQRLLRHTWDTARIGELWGFLETLEAGSRIAWFAAPADFYYPLFGRRLQHRPIGVTSAGRPEPPMHELWSAGGTEWWEEWSGRWQEWYGPDSAILLEHLVSNLQEAGISHAIVTRWPRQDWPPPGTELASRWGRREWPPQHDTLSRSVDAVAVYSDATSKVFELADRRQDSF